MTWKGLLSFAAGLFGTPERWEAHVCVHMCAHIARVSTVSSAVALSAVVAQFIGVGVGSFPDCCAALQAVRDAALWWV